MTTVSIYVCWWRYYYYYTIDNGTEEKKNAAGQLLGIRIAGCWIAG